MDSSIITGVSDLGLVIAPKSTHRDKDRRERKKGAKPASIFIYATQRLIIPYTADYITD